jgi:sortase A
MLRYSSLILLLTGFFLFSRGAYIHAKAGLAWYLLRAAWEERLARGVIVKPWSWADTWPVARLLVPKHAIDLVVMEGDTGNVLAFGPGHMELSPLPGQPGNSIISGHRDTTFSFLRDVREGETILLQRADGRMLSFTVTATRVVDAAILDMNVESEIPLLTLVTCYPFDAVVPGGPQRYLVFAEQDAH